MYKKQLSVLFITINTLNNTFQCARGVRNIV